MSILYDVLTPSQRASILEIAADIAEEAGSVVFVCDTLTSLADTMRREEETDATR